MRRGRSYTQAEAAVLAMSSRQVLSSVILLMASSLDAPKHKVTGIFAYEAAREALKKAPEIVSACARHIFRKSAP